MRNHQPSDTALQRTFRIVNKFPIVGFVVIGIACTAGDVPDGATMPPLPQGDKVGRYQLFLGVRNVNRGVSEPVTFRIDTASGQTWQFATVGIKGSNGLVFGWIPITEQPFHTASHLAKPEDK
jgi:hypothetical protein